MGGRGNGYSATTKTAGAVGGITQSEYDLLSSSPQYGESMTGTNDKSVYQYGSAQGLSTAEINLVHSYTFDLYQGLNKDILTGKKGITEFVTNKLNAALTKLPNEKIEVFRGLSVSNPAEFAKSLQKSGSFRFDSFTSTSRSMEKAREFTEKGKAVIFEIKSKTGKNVSKLSSQKDEEEILFRAGTKFNYISHSERNGVVYIKIREN